MPGDGITDVAPIAQNQEKGRSASKGYLRRLPASAGTREEYAYFDGWTELLWAWWSGVQDTYAFPYRTRLARQRDVRIPQLEDHSEWFFTPIDAQYAVQLPGVEPHAGQASVRCAASGLPRSYRQVVIPIEATTDPALFSNFAAWFPAISMHGAREARVATKVLYTVLQVPETSYYTQVTEVVGHTNITGGGFVFP
jgi:hypothetical protein